MSRSVVHRCGLLALVSLGALAMQPARAQGAMPSATVLPGGWEILRRAEEVRSPEIDYAVEFVLKATDPASSWKERTASYMMIAHGKDYSLVMMREPSQFYPGTLLIAKGFYWLLLPRSEKAFQLAPRHVLNGDISNGDLARGNLLAFYKVYLQGEATIRGEPCWHLELTRTTNLAMYKKIHAWITKKVTARPARCSRWLITRTTARPRWASAPCASACRTRSVPGRRPC
jgi:hypothetical protein